jgi:diguanylate cyclase
LVAENQSDRTVARNRDNLLIYTLIRMTLAAQGFDPRLDSHLDALKKLLKTSTSKDFEKNLGIVSDALMAYVQSKGSRSQVVEIAPVASSGEAAVDANEPVVSTVAVPALPESATQDLMQRQDLSAAQVERLVQACWRIAMFRGDSALAQLQLDVDQLRQLFAEGRAKPLTGGIFSRFFSDASALSGQGKQAVSQVQFKGNEALLELLERLRWPSYLRMDVDQFIGRLIGTKNPSEWQLVLADLVELVISMIGGVENGLRETERFLNALSEQLQTLGLFTVESIQGRRESMFGTEMLRQSVDTDVRSLTDSIRTAEDMSQIRDALLDRLSRITRSVAQFAAKEKNADDQLIQREQQMKDKLISLESEAKELKVQIREVHQQALRDALTGIPNRLAYEERIVYELDRWRRFQQPLVIAVWDVDDFKQVNDRHGHLAGDRALRMVAQTLARRVRHVDFLARFGGEEFVTLFIGSPAEAALKVTEQMRSMVEEMQFFSATERVPLTVSCGLTAFNSEDSEASAFARADKALYQAKKEGKNRCVLLPQ